MNSRIMLIAVLLIMVLVGVLCIVVRRSAMDRVPSDGQTEMERRLAEVRSGSIDTPGQSEHALEGSRHGIDPLFEDADSDLDGNDPQDSVLIGKIPEPARDSYLEPIELSIALRAAADRFDENVTSEQPFERFLSKAVRNGFLPFESEERIPDDLRTDLQKRFAFFTSTIQTLHRKKIDIVEELISRANEEGDYLETSIDGSIDGSPRGDTRPGIGVDRKYRDLGVKRRYQFAGEDHPELGELKRKMSNARDHFIREVDQRLEAYR